MSTSGGLAHYEIRVEGIAGIMRRRLPETVYACGWLIDFAPGTEWPEVDVHATEERYYVVSGEVIEGEERYGPGTYVVFAPGSRHRPRERGCSGSPSCEGPGRWPVPATRLATLPRPGAFVRSPFPFPDPQKTLTHPACKDHVNGPAATNPAVNEGRRKLRRIGGVPVLLALLP